MDGTVPKIFYNFYLNFMNFLIFLNSRGPGSKFQISSGGARPLVRGAGPPGPPGSYASASSKYMILYNFKSLKNRKNNINPKTFMLALFNSLFIRV